MALNFAATTDTVNFGSGTTLDNLDAFTYALWICPRATGLDVTLLTKGTGAGNSRRVFLMGPLNNNMQCRIDNSGGGAANDGVAIADNVQVQDEWMFVAATFAGGTGIAPVLYKGTLTTAVASLSLSSSQNLASAASSNAANDQLIGTHAAVPDLDIAWVGIWNVALTPGQLLDQQFRPHKTSGCVLSAHLGHQGGTTVADWSGNGNTGTITTATVVPHVPLRPLFGGESGWRGAFTAAAAGGARPRLISGRLVNDGLLLRGIAA